jgi:hypothetical protein
MTGLSAEIARKLKSSDSRAQRTDSLATSRDKDDS